MWLYGQKAITISCYSVKFGGHKHSGSGKIMLLVCPVILKDHVITLWVGSPHVNNHLSKFGGHRHCGSRHNVFSV